MAYLAQLAPGIVYSQHPRDARFIMRIMACCAFHGCLFRICSKKRKPVFSVFNIYAALFFDYFIIIFARRQGAFYHVPVHGQDMGGKCVVASYGNCIFVAFDADV
jgi:hypothetical protein